MSDVRDIVRGLKRSDIERMDKDSLERLLALLESVCGKERLREFILRVSPHLPPPRHTAPLLGALERARLGPVRVCVSMPPRHAKTVTILHGIAWWLSLSPQDTCAYVSYSDRQALSKSKLCRDIAQRAGVGIVDEFAAASEWRTSAGGGLVAAGALAGITGQGVQGLMVVDDPFKNREEADSSVIRDKVWETFNEVVYTRLEGASVIVLHTRWHADDLIGRLLEQGGWEYIHLPALAEPGDCLGRQPGEALWPEAFDVKILESIRAQIGEWSFAALYQGQPRPRGHAVFGLEHYHDDCSYSGHRVVIYADPAASEKETADYSAMMAMALQGFGDKQTAKVLEVRRMQVTVVEFVERLAAFQREYGGAPVWVEAVGGFKAVPQMLKKLDPALRIREYYPEGSKFIRAQPVAAAWNQGRVTVPTAAPWLKDFLSEVHAFTGVSDAHDDQVDCLSGCWNCGSKQHASFSGIATAISAASLGGWKPRR